MSKGKLEEEEEEPILVRIPSFMTKSFEILGKHLCSLSPEVSVIELRGRHKVTNADELLIDDTCGLIFRPADVKDLGFDYVRERSVKTKKIKHPFNLNMYNRTMKNIDQLLGKFEDHNGKKHARDLSVEYLVLRVNNKELQAMAGTKTDDFMLFFVTTMCENEEYREQLIAAHVRANKDWIFEDGFKHSSLNLVQLIEANKYHEKKRDRKRSIIYWKGYHKRKDIYHFTPIVDKDIAWYLRYNSGYFPDDFVKLKRFYITKTNVIKMMDGGI